MDSQMNEARTITSWSNCVSASVHAPRVLQYSEVLAFIWPQREWFRGWGGWVENAIGADQKGVWMRGEEILSVVLSTDMADVRV